MAQPEEFIMKGFEHYVYHLNMTLYGLEQASKELHIHLNNFLKEMRRECSNVDMTFDLLRNGNEFILLLLYDDDIQMFANEH